MTIIAIIPARGGSKGIKKKNLAPLCGHPLIYYSIKAALESKCIEKVYVSSDDEAILNYSSSLGVDIINRPDHLSADSTPSHPVIVHAYNHIVTSSNSNPSLIVTLQPTSPLRTSSHIDEAIFKFKASSDADSLVSVMKVPHNYISSSTMRFTDSDCTYIENCDPTFVPTRRQDKSTYLARNGAAIYITPSENISEYIWGGKILPYEMGKLESIDIDDRDDLLLAELLLKSRYDII